MLIKERLKVILNTKVTSLLVIGGLGGFLFWYEHHSVPSGYLGYVEGEYVRVASPIAGALVSLPIKRGVNVTIGEPLFILEQENELAARDEALSRYESTKYTLENIKVAKLPGREMESKEAEEDMAVAKEVLRQAQWRLDQKSIKSPVTGFVHDTLYVPGEWVSAGSPITVILPPENIKVRFFVPEGRLGDLKIGQSVFIWVDGQEKAISARITYISDKAEYTPPVIYSREWRSKQVYMLEARSLDHPEFLHPGQPVDVMVATS